MIHHQRVREAAEGRANTYAVLSALYLNAPSDGFIETIRTGGMAVNGADDVGQAALWLLECLRNAESEDANRRIAEYTRLFVLPSGVIPNESYYLDQNQRIGGRVTVSVLNFYHRAGADFGDTCLELPDHIGAELEFMRFLCAMEQQLREEPTSEGLRRCLEFQRTFLSEHLLRWYEPLCKAVLGEATSDLYRAVAGLTGEFLAVENRFVPWLAEQFDSEGRELCACES